MGIRQDGIAFFVKRLGNRPAGHIAVSRFYTPDISWPKCCCWFHGIPLSKLNDGSCPDIHLLCKMPEGDGFHYLCVPFSFFLANLESLYVEEEKDRILIALSAEAEDFLRDLKAKDRVDFSQHQRW